MLSKAKTEANNDLIHHWISCYLKQNMSSQLQPTTKQGLYTMEKVQQTNSFNYESTSKMFSSTIPQTWMVFSFPFFSRKTNKKFSHHDCQSIASLISHGHHQVRHARVAGPKYLYRPKCCIAKHRPTYRIRNKLPLEFWWKPLAPRGRVVFWWRGTNINSHRLDRKSTWPIKFSSHPFLEMVYFKAI